jgi:hypothetical protein
MKNPGLLVPLVLLLYHPMTSFSSMTVQLDSDIDKEVISTRSRQLTRGVCLIINEALCRYTIRRYQYQNRVIEMNDIWRYE